MSGRRWRGWSYDVRGRVLVHGESGYEVDLGRCRDSASVLDRVVQVSRKAWATAEGVGGLVRALDDLVGLQAHVCGGGRDHEIDPEAILRRGVNTWGLSCMAMRE